MGNTTFNGAVRSENGFKVVSKDATSGEISTSFTLDSSGLQATPVLLTDADHNISAADHGSRLVVVPAVTADRTLTLPSPAAGISFKFIYGGAAEETENLIIDTGSTDNFLQGGLVHLDSDADNTSVYSDGNSNRKLTLTDFGIFEINIVAKDSTSWYIWGYAEGADAPAFADS
jgi:hypothetical protein|tara:strand:+ start:6033 stop:6554 length:522 start_codon:yes stop_codon:yes gene_type:complete